MSNSTDKAKGLVNSAQSAASPVVGIAAGSISSVATRVIGSTGTDVTSKADSITILQPLRTQTPRAD